jgi:hypothetical protein
MMVLAERGRRPVNLTNYLSRLGARLAHLPTHTKVLLSVATGVLLVELALRRFAPRSKAYARWKKGIEAVGAVWTAILLSVVYLVSVGPTSLFMRLMRKDLLDRAAGSDPTFWKPHEANPLGPLAAARHQF